MDWLLYSPDLNPIENLWFELKHLINVIDPELCYMTGDNEELMDWFASVIKRAWASISLEKIRALIESMDHCINAVIEADGWYT